MIRRSIHNVGDNFMDYLATFDMQMETTNKKLKAMKSEIRALRNLHNSRRSLLEEIIARLDKSEHKNNAK